ncbi:non-canonical purine NTP pyrophosphatase [Terribacillus sp. 179-K 1B1 HS]|uniref:non-canonical purine NTP pyrophosphatase n=1 Tax=Terribacillus sp. 179-K 1B1 HS TaxID=3142388 RepID=UPI0039A134C8
MRLVIASWNKEKVQQIRAFFSNMLLNTTVIAQNIHDVDESKLTFSGNAHLKVEAVKAHYPNDIILGEDSGLSVDCLNGFPNVKTARFFPGTDKDRANELLRMLETVPSSKRRANFTSSIAILFPIGEMADCHGSMHGWITTSSKRDIRGYSDIFLLSDGKALSDFEEDSLSPFLHRNQALYQAQQHILEWMGKQNL